MSNILLKMYIQAEKHFEFLKILNFIQAQWKTKESSDLTWSNVCSQKVNMVATYMLPWTAQDQKEIFRQHLSF